MGKIAEALFSGIPRTFDELERDTGLSRRTLAKRLKEMVSSREVVSFKAIKVLERIEHGAGAKKQSETAPRFQTIDGLSPSIAYSMVHAAAPPSWHNARSSMFEEFERNRGKESAHRFLIRAMRGNPAKSD